MVMNKMAAVPHLPYSLNLAPGNFVFKDEIGA
jgi:hypothetical protein